VSERFLRLAGRIRGELADLDQLIERALEGWRRVQRSGDDYYLDMKNLRASRVQCSAGMGGRMDLSRREAGLA
jgi:hypothetical protein